MTQAKDLVLGIDGGGTKTVAWLASLQAGGEAPLGIGSAGPGNPRSAGFPVALTNIDAAIDAAFAAAKRSRATIASACLALAGADRPSERSQIESWAAARGLAEQVRVTNDAEPILAAASREFCGVAVISGTGSFAFGRNRAGETARCGGWGYLLGDEGSGYAIALAGLRAAARSADGRSGATILLDRFLQRLHLSSPQELVSTIYRPEFARQQIADLADEVFAAGTGNDPIAEAILADAAGELSLLVSTLVRRLALAPGTYSLALAGGILLHHDEFRARLASELTRANSQPGSTTLVPDPVRGAVVIARAMVGRV